MTDSVKSLAPDWLQRRESLTLRGPRVITATCHAGVVFVEGVGMSCGTLTPLHALLDGSLGAAGSTAEVQLATCNDVRPDTRGTRQRLGLTALRQLVIHEVVDRAAPVGDQAAPELDAAH